jgi:hypothetical protein
VEFLEFDELSFLYVLLFLPVYLVYIQKKSLPYQCHGAFLLCFMFSLLFPIQHCLILLSVHSDAGGMLSYLSSWGHQVSCAVCLALILGGFPNHPFLSCMSCLLPS